VNLRAIAATTTSGISPPVPAVLLRSAGYTIGAGRTQVPAYADPLNVLVKVQALDGKDLKQVENLNINGTIRAIYITGQLYATERPTTKGGDVVTIGSQEWLVVKILETWPTWTKAAIVLQGGQ